MSKIASILLPTYNEKENITDFITQVLAQQKNSPGWQYKLLIVDSNSPDGTLAVVKQLAAKNKQIHTLTVGPGLGVALIEGHRYAIKNLNPDALVQMDSDGQVDPNVIPRMLAVIDQGYDLAIGSRFVKGGQNDLALIRKIFTWGSCLYCRVMMGPLDVGEFTNSARAFTPALFKKVNLDQVPWKENTFIIQPAFLNAAIEAGAKYKEVPLIFRNRAEGYSKNKTVRYTYDILTYGLEARFYKMGFKIPIFKLLHRIQTIIKFALVGFTGTFVDFAVYKFLIAQFGFDPANAKVVSTFFGIQNNFLLNNYWTFRNRKTNNSFIKRLFFYNVVSSGGLALSYIIVYFLHNFYGDGVLQIGSLRAAYNNFYFFATIPPIMIWNFTINHFVTWRRKKV